MNRFLTVVLLFAGISCFAQHSITVSPESNLTVNQAGKVVTVFTLDQELTTDELNSFNSWTTGNASLFSITKNGLIITTEFNPDYNDRNVYTKMFYTMGVNQIKIHDAGDIRSVSIEEFCAHYGL